MNALTIFVLKVLYRVTNKDLKVILDNVVKQLISLQKHKDACEKIKKEFGRQKGLKVEFGGGLNSKSGWINLDYNSSNAFPVDLRKKLPFEEASVKEIYSEHCFEHFSFAKEQINVLKECFRILEVDGLIHICVPDTGKALKSYSKDLSSFYREKYWGTHVANCYTPMSDLNWLVYMNEQHKTMYDFKSLACLLESMGFYNIKERNYDSNLDSEARKQQTMYVVAQKAAQDAPRSRVHRNSILDAIIETADTLKKSESSVKEKRVFARLIIACSGVGRKTLIAGKLSKELKGTFVAEGKESCDIDTLSNLGSEGYKGFKLLNDFVCLSDIQLADAIDSCRSKLNPATNIFYLSKTRIENVQSLGLYVIQEEVMNDGLLFYYLKTL